MYSNIIQQNINYTNSLQDQILGLNQQINDYIAHEFKVDRDESLALREKEINIQIEKAKSEIKTLKIKLNNLTTIEILKTPISSENPENPNKIKIITIALVASIFLSVILSFLKNFWVNNKAKIIYSE